MSEELYHELYEYQLQQVNTALTTDPNNKELIEVKNKLEQDVIQNNLKFEAAKKEEEAAMKASKLNENKYKWTDDMIVNKINWKYGDDCQATDPVDGKLHDATIEISSQKKVSWSNLKNPAVSPLPNWIPSKYRKMVNQERTKHTLPKTWNLLRLLVRNTSKGKKKNSKKKNSKKKKRK